MSTGSEFWDNLFTKGQKFRPLPDEDLNDILTHIGPLKDVADIGSGTGDLAVRLASRGMHVTSFDFSQVALDMSLESAQKGGLSELVRVEKVDMNDPAFGKGFEASFDAVFMKLAIAFASDLARALGRISAMLRPQGALVIVTPVLLDGGDYDQRQKNISVPRIEFEAVLHAQFKSVEVFKQDTQVNTWPVVTYICRNYLPA